MLIPGLGFRGIEPEWWIHLTLSNSSVRICGRLCFGNKSTISKQTIGYVNAFPLATTGMLIRNVK